MPELAYNIIVTRCSWVVVRVTGTPRTCKAEVGPVLRVLLIQSQDKAGGKRINIKTKLETSSLVLFLIGRQCCKGIILRGGGGEEAERKNMLQRDNLAGALKGFERRQQQAHKEHGWEAVS